MREQAGDLGVDADRLVLWGLSAGSHMSLLAAARLSGEASPIAATVNHYPITNLEPALGTAWEHAQQLPEDPFDRGLGRDEPAHARRGGLPAHAAAARLRRRDGRRSTRACDSTRR